MITCLLLITHAAAQTEAELARAVRSHPGNADALLELGAYFSRTGQFEKAEPVLRKAVNANSHLKPARLEWANALARLHRFGEASEALQGLTPPEDVTQRIAYDRLLAAIDAGTGDISGAAKAMDDAVGLAPGNRQLAAAAAAAQASLGDFEEQRNQSIEAARAYQKAVELAPQNEDYRLALSIELLRHQTFEPAILVLEEGAKRFPDSVRLRTALGVAYFLVDRNVEAVGTLMAIPSYPPALRYLGEIELQQTASPDAEAMKLLCASSGFDAVCGGLLLRQAMASGDESRRGEIFQRLTAAARTSPNDPTARCELGKAYEWTMQWKESRTELEACERLQPASVEAHYRLARVYRRLGERELADKEAALRDEAEKRQSEANELHYATMTQFLYTLRH